MPLRFQRRIRVSPGISLNLNKKSVSASLGRRGAHFTVGPKDVLLLVCLELVCTILLTRRENREFSSSL